MRRPYVLFVCIVSAVILLVPLWFFGYRFPDGSLLVVLTLIVVGSAAVTGILTFLVGRAFAWRNRKLAMIFALANACVLATWIGTLVVVAAIQDNPHQEFVSDDGYNLNNLFRIFAGWFVVIGGGVLLIETLVALLFLALTKLRAKSTA